MPYLSTSTWSLHRHLGPLRWTEWDSAAQTHRVKIQPQPETVRLFELPSVLASKGYSAVDICHFHFPSTEPADLQRLRQACAEAGIRFHTLLLDYGDLSSTDEVRVQADLQYARDWIDIAAQAGAERIRIIAGDASSEDQAALERSSRHLNSLIDYANPRGVQVITENFRPLTTTAANCIRLLESSNGQMGIVTDFGNFTGADKYEQLAAILPYSDSVHAKAHYDEQGLPDADEYRQCLDLLPAAGFDGAVALIYDGPGDMWEGLDRIQAIVEPYL